MVNQLRAICVPFASRHPGIAWAAFFVPFFLLANFALAAIGQPKNPSDIALVLRNVFVGTALVELACAAYRRLERRPSI